MALYKALLTTLSLLTLTSALPTSPNLTKRIEPNTQSCTAVDHGFDISYSIDIGVTYANGSGCGNVYDALQNTGCMISNWQCVDDGSGGTRLWFNTPRGKGNNINAALHLMYPMVNAFNCPDN